MKRVPIIRRIPIIVNGDKFQTIASHNNKYDPAVVMNEYPTLEIAREHYYEDMDVFREQGYRCFAIRKVRPQEGEVNGEN